jgi:DNA polymerase IIIc chi subunit
VPKDDEKRAAARERFRFYKTRGYPLKYHKMAGR